jgi:hypothetical protein
MKSKEHGNTRPRQSMITELNRKSKEINLRTYRQKIDGKRRKRRSLKLGIIEDGEEMEDGRF